MNTIVDQVLSDIGQSRPLAEGDGYVMALDAGTSSVRAVLFDEYGCKVAMAQRPLNVTFPQPGWVQQDPVEILSRQIACMIEVQYTSGIHSDRINAVGITNQRETVVVWDRQTGQPIYDAIVWQCRRTQDQVEGLKRAGHAPMIQQRTGLIPDPYFSATKIAWILDNVEGAREMADEGRLLCGTVDTWLIYNLTHGVVHATDYTNASRTMLFDINKLEWDPELCELLRVPMSMLPEARPSSGSFGRVSSDIMTNHPPITGVAGDQQASMYGHCCFEPGSVKNTYGTGCFMLMNIGDKPLLSTHGLLTTIGIAEGGGVEYALEGSVFHAGTVMKWLRDQLGLIRDVRETAALAESVPDTNGCYLVPAFSGIGAPWWNADARGLIAGITGGTTRAHVVRAACESMAYQTADVLHAMEADSGLKLRTLEVDGGGASNDFIMQFQSDILGIDVVRPEVQEMTALGAAYLAGLATGFWKDREELVCNAGNARRFSSGMDAARREELIVAWHEALARALD